MHPGCTGSYSIISTRMKDWLMMTAKKSARKHLLVWNLWLLRPLHHHHTDFLWNAKKKQEVSTKRFISTGRNVQFPDAWTNSCTGWLAILKEILPYPAPWKEICIQVRKFLRKSCFCPVSTPLVQLWKLHRLMQPVLPLEFEITLWESLHTHLNHLQHLQKVLQQSIQY